MTKMGQSSSAAIAAELSAIGMRAPVRNRALRTLLHHQTGLVGAILLGMIVLMAIFAPVLAPHNPEQGTLLVARLPPMWEEGGDSNYPLGTDKVGRDILSRLIYGARVSLTLGLIASLTSAVIGTSLGILSGYHRRLGEVIMRVADAQYAFPFLVIAIAVVAIIGPSFQNLVLTLALWGWTLYARVIRSEVLSIRNGEYCEAARVLGAGDLRIMVRHILPNVMAPAIVLWTVAIAQLIVAESSLSFLGLGVQPPTPSWGNMLAEARSEIRTAWWLATFPGLLITLTVLAVNWLGDGLRDAFDPRTAR